jgi:phage FluMu protein Com
MPIRFRCEHCQQLLGIARRKAGTKVECPTCHALVLVPLTDQEDAPAPAPPVAASSRPAAPAAPEEPLFERIDFDQLLQGPTAGEPSVHIPTVGRQPVQQPQRPGKPPPAMGIDVERVDVPQGSWPGASAPTGYVLTPFRASMLTTVVIVLMALSFVAGLLVGRYVL